jgi:hypothetical protein
MSTPLALAVVFSLTAGKLEEFFDNTLLQNLATSGFVNSLYARLGVERGRTEA